ncbi:MAG: NAD(P)H-dependent oxidoreductase [Pseudomonadota bacterium]|nr:NAD(P)H-dependent oxidoreductase [Pseudomonadota bacterium]
MQFLIVYAHPELQSFNGAMLNIARETLIDSGHQIEVSNLYELGFNPVAGKEDFNQLSNKEVFSLGAEQMNASQNDSFSPDLKAEIIKLMKADVLILQFPMWWFSMPAIMKGWIDRVFAFGQAYDFGRTWDDGVFKGRKAMLSITASAPAEAFLPDGRNGDMERVLWPIHAGILALCGYSVLPPFIAHGIPFIGEESMRAELERYREHLKGIETENELFFHSSDDIQDYRLKANVEPKTPAQHRGLRSHLTN